MAEQAAIQEFLKSWDALPDLTLAIDGASEPAFIWQISPANRRLVLTSRAALEIPAHQRFDVPSLTSEETAVWITTLRGDPPPPTELATLVAQSAGSHTTLLF